MRKKVLFPRGFSVSVILVAIAYYGCGLSDSPLDININVTIPAIDLNQDACRQVLVDREPDQYLGHVTTVLLEDGITIYAVYPNGHGRGPIVMKRSDDGGLTWSERLPTPESWATSREVPTIHRVVDPHA